MRDRSYRRRGFAPHSRYRRRTRFPRMVFLVVAFGIAAMIGVIVREQPQAPRESVLREHVPLLAPRKVVSSPKIASSPEVVPSPQQHEPMLDPGLLGTVALPLEQSSPLDGGFRSAAGAPTQEQPQVLAEAPAELAEPDSAPVLPLPPLPPVRPEMPGLAEAAPMPVPRPSELRGPATPAAPRVAERPSSRRTRTAAAAAQAAQAEDNRSFFEKLFGVQRSSGPALAYAAPEDDVVDRSRGRRLSPTLPGSAAPVAAAQTAIYDISAKTVYLPNGERLEAHSGLGDKMDDPRFAHVRMKGVTPPHVYDLTEREALFHGVRALRLNPVGGSGRIFGRAGLLAHTYLLGPRGDSNGCVSFKDYNRFLQAYLRGEVKRLVVVASL